MGEVISLNAYRKARATASRRQDAAANRLKHGTTPIVMEQSAESRARLERQLDQARLDTDAAPDADGSPKR